MKWCVYAIGVLLLNLILVSACDTTVTSEDDVPGDDPSSAKITETYTENAEWKQFGLQGIEVNSLTLHEGKLLASARQGLYAKDITNTGSGWRVVGFDNDTISVQQTVVFNENDWLARTEYEDKNVFETDPEDYPNLYRTSDGGSTWEPDLNSFLEGTSTALLEVAGNGINPNGAWMHRGEVLKSNDRGENWTIVDTHDEDFIMMNRTIFSSPDHEGHVWFGGETGFFSAVMLKTTSGGQDWEGVVPPQAGDIDGDGVMTAITVSPDIPETVIASDALGAMGKSFDGGQSWEIKSVNRLDGIQITDIQNSSLINNRVYAAGSWYRSRIPTEESGFQFDHEFDREALFLLISDEFGDSWTFSFSEEFSGMSVNSIKSAEIEGAETVIIGTTNGVYLWLD